MDAEEKFGVMTVTTLKAELKHHGASLSRKEERSRRTVSRPMIVVVFRRTTFSRINPWALRAL